MDIKLFQQEIFQKAKDYGFRDAEIYYVSGNSFDVRIFKGEVSQYKNQSHEGLSFRGTYEGKMGYAFTERLDLSVIDTLIQNAAGNAKIIEEAEAEKLFEGEAYEKVEAYNESLKDFSAEQKIQMAKEIDSLAYGFDPRVKVVSYSVLGTGEDTVYMANTRGLELSHRSNSAYAYVIPQVEENGVTKVAVDFWMGRDLKELSPKALAEKAVGKALSYLGAAPIATEALPVIFDNVTAAELLFTFAGNFFAENVHRGLSLLKGRLGEQIASEKVSIRDDGIYKNSLGNLPFDSEGVATKQKSVIESGKLQTFLYNLKAAQKDGCKSTGNGFKPNFKSPVATACTNFYIVPSEQGLDDIIKSVERGFLVTELAGLHSGANTISGDFSLSAEGFLIENGKKSRPIDKVTVAGNFFELLKNVEAVANDLRFDLPSPNGTIGSPSLLISKLSISGT